jgi:hypothetical protein
MAKHRIERSPISGGPALVHIARNGREDVVRIWQSAASEGTPIANSSRAILVVGLVLVGRR